jgi:hypothetical protein
MKEIGIDDPQAMLDEIAGESEILGAKPTEPKPNDDPMPVNSGQLDPAAASTAVQ